MIKWNRTSGLSIKNSLSGPGYIMRAAMSWSVKYEFEDSSPMSVHFEPAPEKEFFIDNLPVRIHFIIVMIRWTGLAPWEFSRWPYIYLPSEPAPGYGPPL